MAACLMSLSLGLRATAGLGYTPLSTKPPTIMPSHHIHSLRTLQLLRALPVALLWYTCVYSGNLSLMIQEKPHLNIAASLFGRKALTRHKSIVFHPYSAPLSVKTKYYIPSGGCLSPHSHHVHTYTYYCTVHNQRCYIVYILHCT